MNFSATVLRLANETLSIYRPGAVSIDAYGVATTATGSTTTGVVAVFVAPARTIDLKHLPEGDRKHKSATITTVVEVLRGDIVTTSTGESYEIKGITASGAFGFWTSVGIRRVEQ